MAVTPLAEIIASVFYVWQAGMEVLHLAGIVEPARKKLDRLLRADFEAGLSALQSAMNCPPRDKHRYDQLKEARRLFRRAVPQSKKLTKACAHLCLALCHHQLAVCDAIRSRRLKVTSRSFKVRGDAAPKHLFTGKNSSPGLRRNTIDELLKILEVSSAFLGKLAKTGARGVLGGGLGVGVTVAAPAIGLVAPPLAVAAGIGAGVMMVARR